MKAYTAAESLQDLARSLAAYVPDSDFPPSEGWDEHMRRWAALLAWAEKEVQSVTSAAFCMPQEWASRIDCVINTHKGSVGEMIRLSEISATRLHEAAGRLVQKAAGEGIELINPI